MSLIILCLIPMWFAIVMMWLDNANSKKSKSKKKSFILVC